MVIPMRNMFLAFLYFIGAILVYPILLYFLQNYKIIYSYLPLLPLHSYIQVFFSGPFLIVVGGILFFRYKHKVFGLCFFLTGVLWIGAIFYELIAKNL
ncbi:hypothetical protein CK934_18700 [Chitinophaga sp. MD30]|nr:hypothetical protein CK934_18700 [Chitinophaga sp. MD30]